MLMDVKIIKAHIPNCVIEIPVYLNNKYGKTQKSVISRISIKIQTLPC
jgi:hypothetical protein